MSAKAAAKIVFDHMVQARTPGGMIICDSCDYRYKTVNGFATESQVAKHIAKMLDAAGLLAEK